MLFEIRVRVKEETLGEFGRKLKEHALDRSLIRGETFCLKDDPAVGFSVWEAESPDDLNRALESWLPYYSEVEITELITPAEAMRSLGPMKR